MAVGNGGAAVANIRHPAAAVDGRLRTTGARNGRAERPRLSRRLGSRGDKRRGLG